MAKYYVNYRIRDSSTAFGKTLSKTFNTRQDALKFAYQKAKNFRSEVYLGRMIANGVHDGQIICIKNKRFYIVFNHRKDRSSPYGREYILHSDGTLGE